jgi:hypothetical protein
MICKSCGWWERICHCQGAGVFNTTKDKLYHFTHQFSLQEQPLEIRGKDHWQKEIKKRGLSDDFTQDYQRHVKEISRRKDSYQTAGKAFIRDQITSELREKGLYHKLLKRR